MPLKKKIILHAPSWDSPALRDFVEACVRDKVKLVCVIGPDCERVHDVIDELIVLDGLDSTRWEQGPVTTWHTLETVDDVWEFARLWEVEGVAADSIEEIRLFS